MHYEINIILKVDETGHKVVKFHSNKTVESIVQVHCLLESVFWSWHYSSKCKKAYDSLWLFISLFILIFILVYACAHVHMCTHTHFSLKPLLQGL